jgi:hypothetical protein
MNKAINKTDWTAKDAYIVHHKTDIIASRL